MMAMDGATATGGKEEIMAGRGSASTRDAGEFEKVMTAVQPSWEQHTKKIA